MSMSQFYMLVCFMYISNSITIPWLSLAIGSVFLLASYLLRNKL